jgi:acetyl-CoA acyltransferase
MKSFRSVAVTATIEAYADPSTLWWMSDALIIDAVRSPIGKRNGSLSSIRGDELAAQVLNALVARNDLDPADVEDVQMGCVSQIGEQGWNVGRMTPLVAGWPESVCGTTVDRQCGSSMQTNFNASAAVRSGQLDLVISAGVETMSRVPMGSSGGDLSDKLLGRWEIVPQGISAELLADEWGFTREQLDAYSLESHRRALAAIDEGRFENEIVPIDLANPHVGVQFAVDETPRRETSAAALASLRPAFRAEGKVTAGSSSQICDGAAAVLVASEAAVSRLELQPRARFVSFGLAGVDPHRMLHGNPQACAKALEHAGLAWDDVSVIEVNEAFASVVLQFARDAGLEDRWEDINPNGGGISLGHPLGATGARMTATLLNELERRDARYGIATMCVGFGMAIAGVVERL